jgi:hypothetical protein
MLDFESRFGRHAQRRLREDKVIWLITADAQKTPQPRPVVPPGSTAQGSRTWG